MKTKKYTLMLFLALSTFLLTAAVTAANLYGHIIHPWSNAKIACPLSYVTFVANNGKVYTGSVTSGLPTETTCNFKVSNVPSGTSGTLKAKMTVISKNTYIYTCWYSEKKITTYWWSGKVNMNSWNNHPDSLIGSGNCQPIK